MSLFHSKKSAAFLGTILAMLGFSGCDGGIIESRCEYGSPHCDFKLDLTVVNEKGEPIPGIEVNGNNGITDADGNFKGTVKGVFPDKKVVFFLKDVDGEENGGRYKEDTVRVSARKIADGDGHWFAGTYEGKAKKTLKLDE